MARLYKILCNAEDDLIKYNVEKRIINYGEQTKQIANLDAAQQVSDNTLLMDYTTTKALMDWLEKQLGERAKAIRASKQFTDKVKDISRLQSRISNLQLMSSEGGGNNVESQNELAKAQKELRETTANVKKLTLDIEAGSWRRSCRRRSVRSMPPRRTCSHSCPMRSATSSSSGRVSGKVGMGMARAPSVSGKAVATSPMTR